MSRKRLPKDCMDVLLIVHYQDGFCTVQAVWDKALFPITDLEDRNIVLLKGSGNNVYIQASKNSSEISRRKAVKIAELWLNGEYITVYPGTLPDIPPRDWMS